MKDKLYIGLLAGLTAPFIIVALIYLLRFNYLSVTAFIEQAFVLKVHLKIVAIGVFFANLGLFLHHAVRIPLKSVTSLLHNRCLRYPGLRPVSFSAPLLPNVSASYEYRTD